MAEFTSDWFTNNIPNFEHIRTNLIENLGSIDSILEIGSHEGRSTCWALENMLSDTGSITCVDPFANNHINPFTDQIGAKGSEWELRFRRNTAEAKKPKQNLTVHVALSYPTLAQMVVEKKQFDFIYIDGNHCCDNVLADAVMSWSMLKPGGIMLFDDYLYEDLPDVLDRGKIAIDAFCTCFTRQIDWYTLNYQLGIGKKITKEKK